MPRGKVIQLRGKVTKTEIRGISQAWREGYSYDEIARESGRTPKTIERVIHEDLGYARPRFTKEDLNAMKYAYEEELHTCEEIAEMFDISSGSVYYMLHKAHVRMRRVGWRRDQTQTRTRRRRRTA